MGYRRGVTRAWIESLWASKPELGRACFHVEASLRFEFKSARWLSRTMTCGKSILGWGGLDKLAPFQWRYDVGEVFLTELPLFILRQQNITHSARLRKRAPTKVVDSRLPGHYGPQYGKTQYERDRERAEREHVYGNLKEDEYRFWEGTSYSQSQWRRCRACGHAIYNGAEAPEVLAKKHLEESNPKCTILLTAAYKALLKCKKCVMCDKFTSKTHWGVPVCGVGCANKFRSMTSNAVSAAVDLIRHQMRRR